MKKTIFKSVEKALNENDRDKQSNTEKTKAQT